MSSNLASRVIVAVIGIPAAFGVVYVGGWALAGALAVICVAGTREAYRLAELGGVRPLRQVGYLAAGAAPFCVFLTAPGGLARDPISVWLWGAIWMMLVMLIASRTRSVSDRPLASAAVTVFAVLYAGFLPALLILLRHPSHPLSSWASTWLVFLPLVAVWSCDTLAYVGGSIIGGPKLTPLLSPNKTWAGAVTGTMAGVVAAPVYGILSLWPNGLSLPVWQLLVFGLLVSIVGQAGDVAESLFKREAGTKDSGTFFGGHGGVMDRFDSLYWAVPTSVILLSTFGVA